MQARLRVIEIELDREDLPDSEFERLNREANQIQEKLNASAVRINTDTLLRRTENQEILLRICAMRKDGRMAQVIDDYGQQFIGDYTITAQFQVRSSCFNSRSPNSPNTWQFANHEQCVVKVRDLVYDRIYTFYFRESN